MPSGTDSQDRPTQELTEGAAQERAWFDANRRMWDERVPIHVEGSFYDVQGFVAGETTLRPFELEDVGDVTGRSLVHLQCHFGLDTLSWARRGALVTGLDFSAPAVLTARGLAARTGLPATFAHADVYDAPVVLAQRYDIVYTGLGALCWLPDLERWADTIDALTKPGGMVYVAEFHPLTDALADDELRFERDYFSGEAHRWEEPGTYADLDAETTANLSFEWIHPVSHVLDALARRGLHMERFREHDYTLFPRWSFLEKSARDAWRLPNDMPRVPLMYSVRFRKPS